MSDNLISLYFKGKSSCIGPTMWQYDYGQVLVFEDLELDEYFEVHFANTRDKGLASVHMGVDKHCEIPSGYFMSGLPIYGWVYAHPTDKSGETVYSFAIPIKTRPKPDEDIPEDEQSTIERAIEALNTAVEDAQTAQNAAEESATEAAASAQESADAAVNALRSVTFNINEEEGTLEVTIP